MSLTLVLQALLALPKILDSLERLGAAIKKAELDKAIRELEGVTNDLNAAKTLEDKMAVGKRLSDLFKRL